MLLEKPFEAPITGEDQSTCKLSPGARLRILLPTFPPAFDSSIATHKLTISRRGAVKSNIGHLEGTSGIAGIIKTVLVLETGVIPPNANFERLNLAIDAQDLNLAVYTPHLSNPVSYVLIDILVPTASNALAASRASTRLHFFVWIWWVQCSRDFRRHLQLPKAQESFRKSLYRATTPISPASGGFLQLVGKIATHAHSLSRNREGVLPRMDT